MAFDGHKHTDAIPKADKPPSESHALAEVNNIRGMGRATSPGNTEKLEPPAGTPSTAAAPADKVTHLDLSTNPYAKSMDATSQSPLASPSDKAPLSPGDKSTTNPLSSSEIPAVPNSVKTQDLIQNYDNRQNFVHSRNQGDAVNGGSDTIPNGDKKTSAGQNEAPKPAELANPNQGIASDTPQNWAQKYTKSPTESGGNDATRKWNGSGGAALPDKTPKTPAKKQFADPGFHDLNQAWDIPQLMK